MKVIESLLKNFRLLFRSKETAFTIIFGPLLIILLVGFAFSGGDELAVSIGVHSEEYTPLADEMIQTLQESYTINIWATQEECIEKVKSGIDTLCVLFPEDFVIEEGKINNVVFNVDPSRINLVYQVIDGLSTQFTLQKEALSIGLTSDILNNVNITKTIIQQQIDNTKEVQDLRAGIEKSLVGTEGKMQAGEINFSLLDLRLLRGRATSLEQDAQTLFDLSNEELRNAIDVLNDIENSCDECANSTKNLLSRTIDDFWEILEEIDGIIEDTPDKLREMHSLIDYASKRITEIETDYGTVQEDITFVSEQLTDSKERLEEIKVLLRDISANLKYAHDLLEGMPVVDSNTIVNPIQTEIVELTSEKNNLNFTYPYILMLVIMFMGLMLGSTLIVTDKNSQAAFRNFTTATRDEFHIAMSFITTLCILCIQVFIILIFSAFIVTTPLFNNFGTTLVIILLAIALFSFLGMIIGYLARSQEGATITTLALGIVMLFVSNLVIPTEGMRFFVRIISSVNPYVLLSELLKKSMLFNVSMGQFAGKLFLVFLLAIALLIATVVIQQRSRKKYFKQQATIEVKKTVKKVKPLELDGKTIKDEFELLSTLDVMNRQTFNSLITEDKNPIYQWVYFDLDNKKLAKKLKAPNKEKMILALDKHLKQLTKEQLKKKD